MLFTSVRPLSSHSQPCIFQLAALHAPMLAVGAVAAILEQFSVRLGADGRVLEGLPIPWDFFRPDREFDSPVLGPVHVVATHEFLSDGSVQTAGLFAKSNSYADFLAVALPMALVV